MGLPHCSLCMSAWHLACVHSFLPGSSAWKPHTMHDVASLWDAFSTSATLAV